MRREHYSRDYQRTRRASDPERARAESRAAYEARKARELADPALKERRKLLALEWRAANPDKARASAKAMAERIKASPDALEQVRTANREAQALYRTKPESEIKIKARSAISSRLRRGRLAPLPCEVCASPDSEAHHPDYSQPLLVVWLCKLHHEAKHSH